MITSLRGYQRTGSFYCHLNMQVKPIKRSKEFHCDSSTESSNNLCDIDRDIQYKTIRREQTAAPFFQFFIPQEKSFDRKESKRNISRTYQEEHIFRGTIV